MARGSASLTPPSPQPAVDQQVHAYHAGGQDELDAAREPLGIDRGQQVILDEVARITRLAGALAQRVLPHGQRADPSAELHEAAPRRRRQLQPGHPAPFQRQQRTQGDEQDEGQVDGQDGVGGEEGEHGPGPVRGRRQLNRKNFLRSFSARISAQGTTCRQATA